ncbi:MAG: nucleotidyltransferase domain-containing protein [Caldilineaceae bacterium]|nr:nucleotidyltransferase domain-containing protein [Caldilineaceae bacterium]
MVPINQALSLIRAAYPNVQAVYLFGSYATAHERPDSDADIALLLPHAQAKAAGPLLMSDLRFALESQLGRSVDLINLRLVSTVLQKEIVATGRRIDCADRNAAAEFEMLVLSFYQKLNQERREILEEFFRSKRAYAV